jgi:hypothetical protein
MPSLHRNPQPYPLAYWNPPPCLSRDISLGHSRVRDIDRVSLVLPQQYPQHALVLRDWHTGCVIDDGEEDKRVDNAVDDQQGHQHEPPAIKRGTDIPAREVTGVEPVAGAGP